jgi:hypothetical protein
VEAKFGLVKFGRQCVVVVGHHVQLVDLRLKLVARQITVSRLLYDLLREPDISGLLLLSPQQNFVIFIA